MSLGRRMFAGSLWATLDGWASETGNLLVFLILVRLLGPEEFGVVALATVFTAMAIDLAGYSVSQVLVQRRDLTPALCDAVFWLVLGLAAVAATMFVALAPVLAALFDAPSLSAVLRWLCLALLLHAAATVPLALLTRGMRFDVIAKRSLAMVGGGGVVSISMALHGMGAWALVGQALAQSAISVILLFLATDWRPGRRGGRGELAAIRAYAANVAGNRIIMFLDQRAAHLVLGLFLGTAAVGHFSVAMRLVDILIRMFVVPVTQVALPGIAEVQAEPGRVRGILENGIAASSLVSCPAFIGTIVIAPLLVPLALGDAWLGAIVALQLLALRGLVWPVVLYGVALLYGIGRPGHLLKLNGIDLVVSLVALAAAAPFGLAAVAAASSLRVILVRWPLVGGAISRQTGLRLIDQARLMMPALAGALLMAAVVLACQRYLLAEADRALVLAGSIVIGALTYALAAWLLQPRLVREALSMVRGLGRSRAARHDALGNG